MEVIKTRGYLEKRTYRFQQAILKLNMNYSATTQMMICNKTNTQLVSIVIKVCAKNVFVL